MILSELQAYIAEQKRVSLAQIAVKFGIDADALRGMLSCLIRKGRVQKLPIPSRCHGCIVCAQEAIEFYEWMASEAALGAAAPDVAETSGLDRERDCALPRCG
ncbi:MAG: FeoC-like transcriptional regulator [Phormidesmis sp.]